MAILNLPAWDSPRWIGVVAAVLVVLVPLRLDRWASDRKARLAREEQARRRAVGRARGQVMATTAEHRALVPRVTRAHPSPVSAEVVGVVNPGQRALLETIRSLQRQLDDAERELLIRPEPDPILRALLAGPLSLSQLAATVGLDLDEAERRCLRLIHITEQVERIRVDGRGDWKFALCGRRSARRPGTFPARGKAG